VAMLLASHGFAALSLSYFGVPGLPLSTPGENCSFVAGENCTL
jgi:hypothetical protein